MPRLFIGTLVDASEQIRAENFLRELKSSVPELFDKSSGIRFTSASKLHMTWVFIGDVPSDSLHDLNVGLARQMDFIRKQKPVSEIQFDTIEFWQDETAPRLIVQTPSSIPQKIFECAEKLREVAEPFQKGFERKHFKPHITLARLKNPLISRNVRLDLLKSCESRVLKLTDIGLFESLSENGQTVYRPIAIHKL